MELKEAYFIDYRELSDIICGIYGYTKFQIEEMRNDSYLVANDVTVDDYEIWDYDDITEDLDSGKKSIWTFDFGKYLRELVQFEILLPGTYVINTSW